MNQAIGGQGTGLLSDVSLISAFFSFTHIMGLLFLMLDATNIDGMVPGS